MSMVPTSVSVCAIAGLDAVVIGDVERYDVRIAALGLDLGAQALQPLDAPPGQRHAGAGARQDARELRAQAARRARHERDAARQIDGVAHGGAQCFRGID